MLFLKGKNCEFKMKGWQSLLCLFMLMNVRTVLSDREGSKADTAPEEETERKDKTDAEQREELLLVIKSLQEEVKLLHENVDLLRMSDKDLEADLNITDQHTSGERRRNNRRKRSTSDSSGGVYIRWGRDVCPSSADRVYSGLAAGPNYVATGGGANYLCLPESPVYDRPQSGVQDRTSKLYGVQYRFDFPPIQSVVDHDVPCAVCVSIGRSTVLMVPARPSCPSGWTTEYYGFLMAERGNYHKRTQYVCLDGHPTSRTGTAAASTEYAAMQPVEGICPGTVGGLPCGPYVNGYELTCAVCTK